MRTGDVGCAWISDRLPEIGVPVILAWDLGWKSPRIDLATFECIEVVGSEDEPVQLLLPQLIDADEACEFDGDTRWAWMPLPQLPDELGYWRDVMHEEVSQA